MRRLKGSYITAQVVNVRKERGEDRRAALAMTGVAFAARAKVSLSCVTATTAQDVPSVEQAMDGILFD